MKLFDGDSKEVELPVAYAETGGYNISIGEESWGVANSRANQKRLIITEGTAGGGTTNLDEGDHVYKDDYFILTSTGSGSAADGSAKSYLLQYKGADKQTKSGPKMRFKNLGSGETLEYSVSSVSAGATGTVSTIKLGGYSFIVQNASSVEADDFQLDVDLDGSGAVGANTVTFLDSFGAQFTFNFNVTGIANASTSRGDEWVMITQSTPNGNDYDNILPNNIILNITGTTDPEVRSALTGLTLKTPDGKTDVAYGYTSMGAYVTRKTPSSDPQELVVEYPDQQMVPQVYVTAQGATTKTATTGRFSGTARGAFMTWRRCRRAATRPIAILAATASAKMISSTAYRSEMWKPSYCWMARNPRPRLDSLISASSVPMIATPRPSRIPVTIAGSMDGK